MSMLICSPDNRLATADSRRASIRNIAVPAPGLLSTSHWPGRPWSIWLLDAILSKSLSAHRTEIFKCVCNRLDRERVAPRYSLVLYFD